MAKYATTEELHKCLLCGTQFALRECKQIQITEFPKHECPGCNDAYLTFAVKDKAGLIYLWGSRSGQIGVMKFKRVSEDTVSLPSMCVGEFVRGGKDTYQLSDAPLHEPFV